MSTFQIHYKKESVIEMDYLATQYDLIAKDTDGSSNTSAKNRYNPFQLQKVQNYNPIHQLFFELNESNYQKITLNYRYGISGEHLVNRETGEVSEKAIFFKFAPLLDPIRYMLGKYDLSNPHLKTLPTISNTEECYYKLADVNNVAYVDSFFSYLASQLRNTHNVFHSLDFYGSYLGIQDLFRTVITDDVECLQNSPFFAQNLNKLFFVDTPDNTPFFSEYNRDGSKRNRQRIHVSASSRAISIDAEDLEELSEIVNTTTTPENTEVVYEKETQIGETCSVDSDCQSRSSLNSADLNYSSDDETDEPFPEDDELDLSETELYSDEEDDDDNSHDDEEEDDDDDSEIYAFIKDFPTQMICLEKCSGTLYELLISNEINSSNAASCLFQIVMTLLIYQKAFDFTHNDLHTDNIVYSQTEIKHLYYCYNSKIYRVPTHGRIFKIIDFGRSIYRFQGKLFCSDSFSKYGDAYSQYNFPPYMNDAKPRIDPNPSFDLCRLGCSIYEFIIQDEMKVDTEFEQTIKRWCMDKHGKNVLNKRNGEERYPGFKLYRMISRNVIAHTPEAQLEFAYFSQFEISLKKIQKHKLDKIRQNGINIDEIPSYV